MTELIDRTGDVRPQRFRPYPEYMDSGVEWLGQIPAHWEVKPIKAGLVRNDSGVWGQDFDDDGTIVLRSTEQTVEGGWRIDEPARRRLDARDATCARLGAGDLLVTKSSGSSHHIGKTSIVDEVIADLNCCFSNFMQRLRVSAKHAPQFFWYFMNSPVARQQLVFLSSTTTGLGNLSGSILGAIRMSMAPSDEQHAIADFLDRETAQIDALVARKERLIELLREKRTALISRAVSRGLPPDAARLAGLAPHPKLKPSGIDWPGAVPQDWRIVRIGREITLQRGVDITKDEQQEGEVPVVSSGGISSFHDVALTAAPGVVVGRKGTAGAVHYITVDFWPHDTTLYVKDFCGNHPRYVYFKLMSMDLASFDTGSANPTVNRNLVHPVVVSWPPVPEQSAIAAFLDRETGKIDALIAKVREAIDHLKEFRTALISAAVTGKIDVREAVLG